MKTDKWISKVVITSDINEQKNLNNYFYFLYSDSLHIFKNHNPQIHIQALLQF